MSLRWSVTNALGGSAFVRMSEQVPCRKCELLAASHFLFFPLQSEGPFQHASV